MTRFIPTLTVLARRILAVATLASISLATVHADDHGDATIQRDGIALTLKGAETILAAAVEKAEEMGLKVNITIVDAGGHLVAFKRMDGARPASIYTSMSKAATAALKLGDTGPIGELDTPGTHLNLSIENTAAMSGGKFTTLFGGVAIVVEDQVIGGIGVGGAKGSEDAEIARAGLEALLDSIKG